MGQGFDSQKQASISNMMYNHSHPPNKKPLLARAFTLDCQYIWTFMALGDTKK